MTSDRFYYIPRTDMDSMTPGRIIAQGTHAAHYFSKIMEDVRHLNKEMFERFNMWKKETSYGFGTAIVLKPNKVTNQIDEFNMLYNRTIGNPSVICNILIDPEYVIVDGDTIHLVPNVITGLIFFGRKDQLEMYDSYDLFDYNFEKE